MEQLTNVELASAVLTIVNREDGYLFFDNDEREILVEVACRLNDTPDE